MKGRRKQHKAQSWENKTLKIYQFLFHVLNIMLDIFPKKLYFGNLAFDCFCMSRKQHLCVCLCMPVYTCKYAPVLLKGRRSKSVCCVCEYVCVYLHAYLGDPKKMNPLNLTQIIVCQFLKWVIIKTLFYWLALDSMKNKSI